MRRACGKYEVSMREACRSMRTVWGEYPVCIPKDTNTKGIRIAEACPQHATCRVLVCCLAPLAATVRYPSTNRMPGLNGILTPAELSPWASKLLTIKGKRHNTTRGILGIAGNRNSNELLAICQVGAGGCVGYARKRCFP